MMTERNMDRSPSGSVVARPAGTLAPWLVASFAGLLFFAGTMNTYTFGVFFKPMADALVLERGPLSGVFLVRNVVAAAFSVPVAFWVDRYGVRKTVLPSIAALGLSAIALSRVSYLWQVYVFWGVVTGIGIAAQYVGLFAIVMKWHKSKPGMAIGIVAAGGGLAAIASPPIAERLIEAYSWQRATVYLGLIVLAVSVVSFFFVRDPPASPGTGGPKSDRAALAGLLSTVRSVPSLMADRTLLLITLGGFFFWIAGMQVTTHLVNYATDIGTSPATAASMVALSGFVGLLSRLILGAMADRTGARKDLMFSFSLASLSFIALALRSIPLIWVWAVLFGVAIAGGASLLPVLVGEHFGADRLSERIGVTLIGGFLGGALGPWIGGALYDWSGNYLLAWLLAAVCSALAVAAVVMIPSRRFGQARQVS